MSTEQWKKAASIFDQAVQLADADRDQYLARALADDDHLRRRVYRLLDHDSEDLSVASSDLAHQARKVVDELVVHSRIGGYEILKRLGSGGMGTVYLARDGDNPRRVAIKLLQHGVESQRFQQERLILAKLEHPNIARLVGSGTTPDGHLFVVMDFAEGPTITEHCRLKALGTRDRIRLFMILCDAVQYAHRNLIIHRDIKPGNILVSDDGRLKLLDFGIAKLFGDHQDLGAGVTTRSLMRVMTPRYASPEQFAGGPITISTDVYSLGVVLYEILTGHRPFQDAEGSPRELEAAILSRDPPLPSRSVATTTTGSRRLQRELRGDLDTILVKALATDSRHRYQTVSALAEDLRRFLDQRPIDARPISMWYQFRKFALRNRALSSALVIIATLTLGFSGLSFYQADQLRQQRDSANRETRRATAVTEILVKAFDQARPVQGSRADVPARKILEDSIRYIDENLVAHPQTLFDLKRVIGEIMSQMDLHDQAVSQLTEAIAIGEKLDTLDGPSMVDTYRLLGEAALLQGDTAAGHHYLDRAEGRVAGSVPIGVMNELRADVYLVRARLLLLEEETDLAQEVFEAAIASARRAVIHVQNSASPRDIEKQQSLLVRTLTEAARAQQSVGSLAKALDLYQQAYEAEMALPVRSQHWIDLVRGLAAARLAEGNTQEALYLYSSGLVTARSRHGPGSKEASTMLAGLGQVYYRRGDLNKAVSYFSESLASVWNPAGLNGDPTVDIDVSDALIEQVQTLAAVLQRNGIFP